MSTPKYKHLEKVRDMVEACFRCGDCRIAFRPAVGRFQVCPIYATVPGKWEPFFARGKIMLANGLLKGELDLSQELADIIFKCMICGSCQTTCNYSYHPSLKHPTQEVIDHPKIWEAFRVELVEAGFSIPRHVEIREYCEKKYNPYFEDPANRVKWIPAARKFPKEADYLLFMGCTEPYRLPEILQNSMKILDAAQINFTILGIDERCCGSVALRTGDQVLAKKLALHNFEAIQQTKATRIITHCAGCLRTLKIDYPVLLPDFRIEILHITELIQELLKTGQLKFTHEVNRKVTYHDPCHLGRHSQIYDAPREILKQLPGVEFVEMQRIKESAWCCGAGGGLKSGFSNLATEIAKTRVQEAIETGADILVTSCPFCLSNLQDAAKELTHIKPIQIIDLLELVLLGLPTT